jgi:hypothetical protein
MASAFDKVVLSSFRIQESLILMNTNQRLRLGIDNYRFHQLMPCKYCYDYIGFEMLEEGWKLKGYDV